MFYGVRPPKASTPTPIPILSTEDRIGQLRVDWFFGRISSDEFVSRTKELESKLNAERALGD
jgi:hypothetical protein